MAFTRTKITNRLRRAGARYLEAMAYADPSGLVYYPVSPIVAYIPVQAAEPTPPAAGRPLVAVA
jgi:hypothetical protein